MATLQGGRVSRRQLVRAGVSKHEIQTRLDAQALIAEWDGVYRVGHEAETVRGRLWGAVLLGGDDAGLSRRTAASARGWLPPGELIHVTSARKLKDRGPIRFHQSRDFVRTRLDDGLPVATVAQTLIDIARTGDRRLVERILDQAEAARELDLSAFPERLPRVLASALAEHRIGSTITRSELEERLIAICDRNGLPRPRCGVDMTAVDGSQIEVDALWERHRVAAELQSWQWHRHRFERDHRKRALLELAGYEVLAFTWRMLLRDEPLVVRRLEQALGCAASPRR